MKKLLTRAILLLLVLIGSFFRLYRLSEVPAGLLQDEAAAGYDAYSLIKTGKDHHGASWPVTFQTFNDWTGHSFNYQLIPSVFFLGLNAFSIRFTVAFLSIVTIVLIYFLGQELTGNRTVSLLTAFLFALSQFSVTTSRWAVQPNTVVFFVTLSLYLFFRGLNMINRLPWWLASFFFFGLSLYTYPSVEGFLPLFVLGALIIIFFQRRKKEGLKVVRESFLAGTIFLLVVWPLLSDHLKRPETITTKLRMVSVASIAGNPVINYLQNYLSYFLPSPLFWKGEVNPTRALPGFGYENTLLGGFYYLSWALIIFAPSFLSKKYPFLSREKRSLLYLYLFLFPVVPSLTVPSGDFQRAIYILPVIIFLSSLAIHCCFEFARTSKLRVLVQYRTYFWSALMVIYLYLQYTFYSYYFGPQYRAFSQWYFQDGLAQVVQFTSQNKARYGSVIFDNTVNQPYIYVLFYEKTDPKSLHYQDFTPVDKATSWLAVKKFQSYIFRKVTQEEVVGGKLVKTVYNSPYSNYVFYEKDNNLIVKFETRR